jgi:hypothetical protein
MAKRGRSFSLLVFVVGLAGFYAVVVALDPWALHWGGRWTPLLYWQGTGKLVSSGGAVYPLYVSFYPSSHFSRLHLDGLRPIGGVQGTGWLCTSRGEHQQLNLSGTVYGEWRSDGDSLVSFRLLEPKLIDVGQGQGFFDLFGKWQGGRLVMEDRGNTGEKFRSGLKIDHASVNLDWGTYSDFKTLCGSSSNYPVHK